MTDLVSTAEELQKFCEKRGWKFCIIGGLALQFWGEQRLTKDVDLTLLTGFGTEEIYIDTLLRKFPARIEDAKNFALRSRVLLLQTENKIGIDISLGAFPFEETMVNRAAYQKYLPQISLKICSAEDLVVLKSFADRSKDWSDIQTVLIKQDNLDWNYIFEQLAPLIELKEAPEILTKLENLRKSYK
ncbi:MAG: nucleotidyl transferase AbiEii/AbiGii toxin family protein [Pyrinomonadaceae bacterium]